jgi:hypothetical protein
VKRLLLVVLLTLTLPAAGSAVGAGDSVTLTISRSAFRPDEGTGLPAGRMYWFFDYVLFVQSSAPCTSFGLDYAYRILADGRLEQPSAHYEGHLDVEEAGRSTTFRVPVGFGPSPGEVVALRAAAVCRTEAGAVRSGPATKRVLIPPHSCELGPLRVLRLKGRAWREDTAEINRMVPLQKRDFVWSAYGGRLGRRSRIVLGAPDCRGFRVAIRGAGFFTAGAYAKRGRGEFTTIDLGASARFRGDQHAGGMETQSALVWPKGRRFGPIRIAEFEVVPQAGRETRVRVFRGAAWVAAGPGAGAMSAPVLVPAGYVAVVRCTTRRECSTSRPTPY